MLHLDYVLLMLNWEERFTQRLCKNAWEKRWLAFECWFPVRWNLKQLVVPSFRTQLVRACGSESNNLWVRGCPVQQVAPFPSLQKRRWRGYIDPSRLRLGGSGTREEEVLGCNANIRYHLLCKWPSVVCNNWSRLKLPIIKALSLRRLYNSTASSMPIQVRFKFVTFECQDGEDTLYSTAS